MTIVDLADLDTFIRDSLFEVRRGIANSRNATQANPMLGVMVDLPEKIDFEIMVTSSHQSLTRSVVSKDSDSSTEFSSEKQTSLTGTSENGAGSGNSTSSESVADTGRDLTGESSTTSENESSSQNSNDNDNKTETSNNTESGTETSTKTQTNSQTQIQTKQSTSLQLEKHKEANDRASKTFDEEEGSWGGQGQISTPALPGGPSCSC